MAHANLATDIARNCIQFYILLFLVGLLYVAPITNTKNITKEKPNAKRRAL